MLLNERKVQVSDTTKDAMKSSACHQKKLTIYKYLIVAAITFTTGLLIV